MAIEEHEFTETNLDELIERLEQDDIPTNIFTVEDKDPMVILGKLNEVIANLQSINNTVTSSDTKANEAITKATQAIADATQALTTANGIDAKATLALQNAVNAVVSANSAIQASTQAVTSANTALTTANTAINTANSAEETAQSAETKADNAITTANTASATATSAKNTAEGIDAKATTALSNSQTAISTANSANATAQEALSQVIAGQGTKVYRDTQLLTSLDIKPIEDNIANNATAINNEATARANAVNALDNTKVDKVTGKQLSTEDYTTTEKTKLAGLYNYNDTEVKADISALQNGKVDKVTGKQLSTEDYTTTEKTKLAGLYNYNDTEVKADISALQNGKVDKVTGKQLSTEDFTTAEKNKLAGLSNYDDAQVQADLSSLNAAYGRLERLKANNSLNNVTYPTATIGSTKIGTADRVIEIYINSNGSYWYKKWLSGWIECGGRASVKENSSTTITFGNISFTNTSTMYCFVSNSTGKTSGNSEGVMTMHPLNNTQAKITAGYLDPNTSGCHWYVCGV